MVSNYQMTPMPQDIHIISDTPPSLPDEYRPGMDVLIWTHMDHHHRSATSYLWDEHTHAWYNRYTGVRYNETIIQRITRCINRSIRNITKGIVIK